MTQHLTASPRPVVSVALAVLVHGALLVAGSFRGTYDAYVHIFLGDHYARAWFSTWETRWYTGFTTVSYPPGTHQMIAALSKVIGLEAGFVVVQLTGVALLVIGVVRMSRLWVSPKAANWAGLLVVVSTSVAEAVHVFGQLPTIIALALLLNATPYVDRWLRTGSPLALLLAITTLAATTACHHVTTLFGSVFFIGPLVARVVVDAWGSEPRRTQLLASIARVGVFGVLALSVLITVVLPYWLWSSSDPISQVPIPHGSRANFLEERNVGLVFFVIPWGMLAFIYVRSLAPGLRGRAWPLALSILLLTLLGTGGTTPIPRLLLGGAFDILTLDRFTFWGTIAILPLAGAAVVDLLATAQQRRSVRIAGVFLAVGAIAAFIFTVNLSQFRPLQPDTIDAAPIAEFLEKDQHDRWRYLTLGFGDQMAWVSAQTTATTVDGNYHSARRLPELVSRPVERLEGAKFRGLPGLGSLQQFVTTPERYNLKFIFSNDTFYDPLLFSSGWHRVDTLINGVVVWERADVTPLPDVLPTSEVPDWQRIMWALLPLTAVAGAALLNGLVATGAIDFSRSGSARAEIVPSASNSRFRRRLRLTPSSRVVGALVVLGFAWVGIGLSLLPGRAAEGARNQVYDFYDDVDFGRTEDAWTRLDPVTRPSMEQYLLERSVRDGLVDGYAKLDTLEILDSRIDGGAGEVDVRARYVTSLTAWTVEETHVVVARDGDWYLRHVSTENAVPVEQFARQTVVDYVDHGRRAVTTETSDYGDILDRPRIAVLDSTLVKEGENWFVIGQVTNLDIDPADITVTGRLRGEDGNELAEYQAGIGTVHKVLPGETVPFRVSFEGAIDSSGTVDDYDGVFDPDNVVQLTLDDEVASYEVEAKALVTGRNLERLAVEDVQIEVGGGNRTLSATIANGSTDDATLPLVVVSYLDDRGEVLWVEATPMSTAVRSQRERQIEIDLVEVSELEQVDVPFDHFDNGLLTGDESAFSSSATIELPDSDDSKVAALRVTAITFEREMD